MEKNIQENYKSKAIGKYLRLSTQKAKRVLEQIIGKNYNEAKLILQFMPYKACKNIEKILISAFYNMKKSSINKEKIFITKAFVNQGPSLKRFQPRAQGRAFQIRKPTCHITIQLENK